MIDQKRASIAAKQGFDLWIGEKPDQAVAHYQEALLFADPMHYGLPDYHSEFAQVLALLGRPSEALEQFQSAIAVQLRQDPDDFSICVVIPRYFLGQHFLNQRRPLEAIQAVEPSLKEGSAGQWLLHWIRALAFEALERHSDAAQALTNAMLAAPDDAKRDQLKAMFAESAADRA